MAQVPTYKEFTDLQKDVERLTFQLSKFKLDTTQQVEAVKDNHRKQNNKFHEFMGDCRNLARGDAKAEANSIVNGTYDKYRDVWTGRLDEVTRKVGSAKCFGAWAWVVSMGCAAAIVIERVFF